jgi:hypothetical protein
VSAYYPPWSSPLQSGGVSRRPSSERRLRVAFGRRSMQPPQSAQPRPLYASHWPRWLPRLYAKDNAMPDGAALPRLRPAVQASSRPCWAAYIEERTTIFQRRRQYHIHHSMSCAYCHLVPVGWVCDSCGQTKAVGVTRDDGCDCYPSGPGTDSDCCHAQSPTLGFCSRPIGHTGDHVACLRADMCNDRQWIEQHRWHVWPQLGSRVCPH